MCPPKRDWTAFQVGDIIDVKDTVNKWYKSEILEIDRSAVAADAGNRASPPPPRLFCHFVGWTSRWDAWFSADDLCRCRDACACDGHLAAPATQSVHTERAALLKKQRASINGAQAAASKTTTALVAASSSRPSQKKSATEGRGGGPARGVTGLQNLGLARGQ